MKRYLTLLLLLLFSAGTMVSYAELPGKKDKKKASSSMNADMQGTLALGEGAISLVTSGSGSTREEAVKNALRSAIEQTFGTFVSANTTVINDNLVKDEIVSISSGNVQGYQVLSCANHGHTTEVSVQAVISINKLVSYAQNKGMSTELAGATFVMNKKMRDLNKKNEKAAFENLRLALKSMAAEGMFDYSIELDEPKQKTFELTADYNEVYLDKPKHLGYSVKAKIVAKANQNTINFFTQYVNTLNALNMSMNEVEEYKKTNDTYCNWKNGLCFRAVRNDYAGHICDIAAVSALTGFYIVDNTGRKIFVDHISEDEGSSRWGTVCYYLNQRIGSRFRYFFDFSGGKVEKGSHISASGSYLREYGYGTPSGLDNNWEFQNLPDSYQAFVTFLMHKRINYIPRLGDNMYESIIGLFFTEEELSKINSIKIEPKTPIIPFDQFDFRD